MGQAIISYSESLYEKVGAGEESSSDGAVIPNNEIISITRFRANGADPTAYVLLAWDWGGGDEKIFASTKGDVDLLFDSSNTDNQMTGDGVKKLQIIITNDNSTESPVIGGAYEATKVGNA